MKKESLTLKLIRYTYNVNCILDEAALATIGQLSTSTLMVTVFVTSWLTIIFFIFDLYSNLINSYLRAILCIIVLSVPSIYMRRHCKKLGLKILEVTPEQAPEAKKRMTRWALVDTVLMTLAWSIG